MPKPLLISLLLLVILVIGFFGLRLLVAAISKRPPDLGWREAGFKPCADMLNCVNSLASDPRHAIEPLRFEGDAQAAQERLVAILSAMPRSRVIAREGSYVYAEFRTAGLGYIDDVEFYLDADAGLIHVRSSARVPYYDFGVNRKRVESIRAAW